MLEVKTLHAWYGKTKVLHGVDITVEPARIVGIVGRNGVGKTTTFRAILGQMSRVEGSICHEGRELVGRPPHVIARTGIGLVPQGRGIFPTLTVEENLRVAVRTASRWAHLRSEVFELFPDLAQKRRQLGGELSGGQQEMLAMGRAIVAEPKVVLLDEPTEGLSPLFVSIIFDTVTKIRERGAGILLIEQDVRRVAKIADELLVMEKGEIIERVVGDGVKDSVDSLESLIRF